MQTQQHLLNFSHFNVTKKRNMWRVKKRREICGVSKKEEEEEMTVF